MREKKENGTWGREEGSRRGIRPGFPSQSKAFWLALASGVLPPAPRGSVCRRSRQNTEQDECIIQLEGEKSEGKDENNQIQLGTKHNFWK